MTLKLRTLDPQARHLVGEDFLAGKAMPDWIKYIKEFDRDVNLEPFRKVVDKVIAKFGADSTASDAWLAPRIHATLRLTRREAADPRVWDYLALIAASDYVRWRWGGSDGTKAEAVRFVGPEYKQAFARLWWGAEMTRNAGDYGATKALFANQDFQNSWARLDLFHHRPASIAAAKFLATFNNGQMATSDQIRQLVRGFNMVLTTTMLDAAVENPAPDGTKMMNKDPVGPADATVPDESINVVIELLEHTANVTSFFKRDRRAASLAATTG